MSDTSPSVANALLPVNEAGLPLELAPWRWGASLLVAAAAAWGKSFELAFWMQSEAPDVKEILA